MSEPPVPRGDLSVTALYTSQTWARAGLVGADLYDTEVSRRVYGVVNAVLGVARWFVRGAPSLPVGLVHRHTTIDAVLAQHAPATVLELAAGLSRRGAALSADPAVDVTEVDLPPVVAYKHALLERTEAGRAVLARPNLRRVPADVTATPLDALATPRAPAAVVAEGLLMYLQAPEQRALWARCAAWLAPVGGVLVFDLLPVPEQPQAGWVGRVLGAMMKRFTGGKGFVVDTRTRADLLVELQAAGFDTVQAVVPAEVAASWGLPHAGEASAQVVFVARKHAPAHADSDAVVPPTPIA